MKLIIAIDETNFYHPQLMRDLINSSSFNIVGVLLVTKLPAKNSLLKNIKNTLSSYNLKEGFNYLTKWIQDYLNNNLKVENILKENKIDYLKIKKTFKNENIISWCENKKPDIIFSSTTMIFPNEILKLPRLFCLNRHSSLLPSYKGLWPLFYSYTNEENMIGLSLHTMSEKIDSGTILNQYAYPLDKSKTLNELYAQNFLMVPKLLDDLIEKINENELKPIEPKSESGYFSFPSSKDFKKFRSLGGRFI